MGSGIPLSFGLAVIGMIAAALAFVVPTLWSRASRAAGVSRTVTNVEVVRTRLAELLRDRDNGAIDDDQVAATRGELERQLLEEAIDEPPPVSASARGLAIAIACVFPVAALALYATFGGAPPAVAETASSTLHDVRDQRTRLVAHLARQPDDGRAWVMLARIDFESDRFADAVRSYERALDASPRIARDAGVWCELADALAMRSGGRLVGRPAELVAHALALDPAHPQALEMAGSAAYERADYRAAALHWRLLLASLSPGTPAHDAVQAAVARSERLASTSLPPPVTGAAPRS